MWQKMLQVGSGGSSQTPAWNGVLYDAGDEYVDVTGGWSKHGYATSINTGTFGVNCDNMSISGSSGQYIEVGTQNKISLKGYTQINVTASCSHTSNHLLSFRSEKTGTDVKSQNLSSGTTTITIPSNDEYYLVFSTGNGRITTVTKIWLS